MAARTKRTRDVLLEEVRELLFEPTVAGVEPYWNDDNLINIMNQQKDFIEMWLISTLEQFNVSVWTTAFVNDQRAYSLPEDFIKVYRILRRTTAGEEFPLPYDKLQSGVGFTTNTNNSNFGTVGYYPTARLVGNSIILSYPPASAEAGFLVIEYEAASPRLETGSQKLPDTWPISVETALVFRTAAAAIDSERAESTDAARTTAAAFRVEAEQYLQAFVQMTQRRFHGKTRGKGLRFGG